MVNDVLKSLDADIAKAMEALNRDLSKVRTGRANATMLDGIRSRLRHADAPKSGGQRQRSGAAPPGRQAWEKRLIPEIEKAIRAASRGSIRPRTLSFVRLPIPA